MGEGRDWTQERTALRDALLRDLDLGGQPLASRGKLRLVAWLSRRHLWWLLLPWWLVRIAWWFLFSSQRQAAVASENRAIDLYRQVTGTDRKAARDQVWRLEWHLAPLVDRPELPGLEPMDEPPGASRAELQTAMDALLDMPLLVGGPTTSCWLRYWRCRPSMRTRWSTATSTWSNRASLGGARRQGRC